MWNFEKIILKNFISHENSEFVFKKDELTLIFGKILDKKDDGANSNGSGKSSIIEGITVALTGETYRDVGKDDFIMDGEDIAEVDSYLFNDFLSKKLRIHWKFTRGKSAVVKIYENDNKKPLDQLTSVNESKKYILNEIGITREDLLNYFIINQDNSNSFFTAGDAKQKEIIGRFANYQIINKTISIIELEKEELVKSKTKSENNLLSQQSVKDNLLELIEEEKKEAESTIDDEVKILEEKIIKLTDEKESLKTSLPNKKGLISDYKKEIVELDNEIKEIEELIESGESVKTRVSELKTSISKNEGQINKYEATLSHSIKCPECDHDFILNSELPISELEKEIVKLSNDIDTFKEEIKESNELIVALREQEESLKTVKRGKKTKLILIDNVEEEIQNDEFKIKKCDNNIKHHHDQINTLRLNSEEKTNITTYEAKIKEVDVEIKKLDKQIRKVSGEIVDKDFWLVHLGKKGFQVFLVNKCISTIEGLCNHFLENMRINLRVKINGYKLLANGELRDKIDIQVIRNGQTVGNFNKYSGGQKERINVASILTLQRLINNSLHGKGLNLLCLDETLDHLDQSGNEICLNIIKMFNITTFVITHNEVENLIEDYNTILVEYKNEKSVIV